MNRTIRLAVIITAAILIFPLAVFHLIPNHVLADAASRFFAASGYTLHTAKVGKTPLPGLYATGVEISDPRGPLLRVDRISCRLSIPALFTGKALLPFDAALGGGTIAGSFGAGKTPEFTFEARNVRLEAIPFFRTATGGVVKGLFRGNGSFRGAGAAVTGDVRAEVRGAEVADMKLEALPLPASTYDRVQATFTARGGRGRLEGLTLQGQGLYARLSGDLTFASPLGSTPLNLSLELMPQPDFMEKQKLVFILMAKYVESPGHFRIPVGGILAKPAVY